jgi:hypothetical protein
MRLPLCLFSAGILVAGCANFELPRSNQNLTEAECRGSNWAELGKRDGTQGVYTQVDQYAYQCGRFGVKVDEAAYMAEWREAYSNWMMRLNPGPGG